MAMSANLKLVLGLGQVVKYKIRKEVLAGRALDPFVQPTPKPVALGLSSGCSAKKRNLVNFV